MALNIADFIVNNTTTGHMQQTSRQTSFHVNVINSQKAIIDDLVVDTTVPGTPSTISSGPLYNTGFMSHGYIHLVRKYGTNLALTGSSSGPTLFCTYSKIRIMYLGGTTTNSNSLLYAFVPKITTTENIRYFVAMANCKEQAVGDYFDIQLPDLTAMPNVYLVLRILGGAWDSRTIVSGNKCSISSTSPGVTNYCINPVYSGTDTNLAHFIGVNGVNASSGLYTNISYGVEDDVINESNRDYANIKFAVADVFLHDLFINNSTQIIPVCFVKGTTILCADKLCADKLCADKLADNKYIPIENINVGDTVITHTNGPKKVLYIIKTFIVNDVRQPINKIFKLAKEMHPQLTSDLYVTGGHSLVVEELPDYAQSATIKVLGETCNLHGMYRLPAFVHKDFVPLNNENRYDIYHLILGKQEIVYANGGVLTETVDKEWYSSV